MAVEEIGLDKIVNDGDCFNIRSSIECRIAEDEKHHLFHKAGIISRFFRDNLIFPLMAATDTASQKILIREDWFSKVFWKYPFVDLRYPRHQQVRDNFEGFDQYIVINQDGKEIRLKCRIIETKGCPRGPNKEVLNHMIVQGNVSTLDNNMPGVYPFLSSYLKNKEENPGLPPARFIVLNHYGHSLKEEGSLKEKVYLPGDMDEWTFIFKKALESIVDEYGSLEMISAHSLGNIPVAGHLKHIKDEEFNRLFPKTLFLSQGPSSLYEITRNLPFELCRRICVCSVILGSIVYFIAKWTGWDVSLDQSIVDRLNSLPDKEKFNEKLKNTTIVVTEVEYDHYFQGKQANLRSSDLLEEIDKRVNLYRLTFNPPIAWVSREGQHNYNMGHMQRSDLEKEDARFQGRETIHLKSPQDILDYEIDHPAFIRHGESLVDAVLRPLFEEALNRKHAASLEGRVISIAVGA